MLKALRNKSKGFTLIELLIVVAIIGILAAIAIPNLMAAQTKGKIVRAAGDTKTGVTQCIVFANDKNANCGSMAILRNSGYANIRDTDPWGTAWVYSPAFADTTTPAAAGEIGACSKGAAGTGDCTFPLTGVPAEVVNGSVGYSSIYGSWQSKV